MEAIFIPVQSFDPVCASAAEQKHCIAIRVQLKLFLHSCCQPVYAPPEICIAAGNKYSAWLKSLQHSCIALMIDARVSTSAPWYISARMLPMMIAPVTVLAGGVAYTCGIS